MLSIRYIPDSNYVEISYDGNIRLWPHIRRVFIEDSDELVTSFANVIRVPIWIFLARRQELGYIIRKYQIVHEFDEGTKVLLKTAKRKSARYNEAKVAAPINQEELTEKLRSVGFKREPTEEQLRNISKLVALPAGATFSVPGAGKTTEALAYYFLTRTEDSKLIVVCPKNAFAAWEEQIELCLVKPPRIVRLTGGYDVINDILTSDPEVMLITYAQLPIVKELIGPYLLTHHTYMFLDESHHIKRGSTGLWGSTVLELSHLPFAKLIMSGTPLPNAMEDLTAQFSFLYPEIDARSDNIQQLIQPIFVRTTKKELGLPEVIRKITHINMRPKQRQLYDLLRYEEARQLKRMPSLERINLRSFGKSVMRLLQLVSNPALLAREGIAFPHFLYEVLEEGDSPKLEYVCHRARQLAKGNQKAIIWSTFVENVETIASRLEDLGADYIHGGVETGSIEESDTRERKIKEFHDDPQKYILVANPAACAEGISLHTVCHHAIYVDRNFNAAQYLQSEDRIHRLGLPDELITNIEILITPDSIDEHVNNRLGIKVERMARVLNDPSLNITPIISDIDDDGFAHEDIKAVLDHFLGV